MRLGRTTCGPRLSEAAAARSDEAFRKFRVHAPANVLRLRRAAVRSGFTLTELLVVISIIGLVAAISIPALKGITKSQTITTGARQLLEDLALARQYAILNRSVVHVVFVPPTVLDMNNLGNDPVAKRLKGGAYSTYAIYADRTIGDQPGQSRPRYLSKWKTLPDGVFIAEHEFDPWEANVWQNYWDPTNRPFHYGDGFWFPSLTNAAVEMPHISFNPDGSLRSPTNRRDEFVHLAQGSILVARAPNGDVSDFSVRESPPGNSTNNYYRIRIDGFTGRPTLERPEIE
jgi:prepilin-type N-terminal cleavage/methylation domain-containing protein